MAHMLKRITQMVRNTFVAATTLPPLVPPAVKKRERQTFPGYITSADPGEDPLNSTDRRVSTTLQTDSRGLGSTKETIRQLTYVNSEMSGALSAYLRTGIPERFTAVAKNPDGTFNAEATATVFELLDRFNSGLHYADGYNPAWSLQTVSEALGKELVLEGAMALEVVLDKSLVPLYFAPVAVSTLEWVPDKGTKYKSLRPIQKIGQEEIDLDFPTFLYTQADPDLTDHTPNSMLESAVQPTFFSASFMQDIQRVVKRALFPRLDIEVDWEKLSTMAPPDAQFDPDKLKAWQDSVMVEIQSMVDDLGPEDALVHLSFLKPTYLTRGNVALDRELEVLQTMIDARQATGAKVMPAVLGRGTTQNAASTDSLLFLKTANVVRVKLNEIYSRAFTLCLRLLGNEVSVEFKFAPLDLRPETELAAFRQAEQSRVLDQLSLGMITDEDACLQLTGRLPPPGYVMKSGTMFRHGGGAGNENMYSGAPHGGGQSGGGANTQSRNPDTQKNTNGRPAKG